MDIPTSTVAKSEKFWVDSWTQHWADYMSTPPHLGPCLELLFPDKSWSFLEIAGGTMRDSAYLAKAGRRVTGSDYLPQVVEQARQVNASTKMDVLTLNAFQTGLPDDAFDVTYHNGLWVNFKDDEDIRKMLTEQVRISRRYIVATVHCAHNKRYREDFREKAKLDRLYDIRFFEVDELRAFLEPYGKTRILPCGSPLTYQLIEGWRWGRLPRQFRRQAYLHAGARSAPTGWHRIMAVTQL